MEEKKGKITRTVFISEWSNPKGGQVYYHEIWLDNGDNGQIGSKEKMPVKLNPGTELTYTIEETSRGNKIKAVMAPNAFTGGRKFQQEDPKVKMISYTGSYVKDLIVAGKVPLSDFEKEFNRMYNIFISRI
jgi:hypothetical protein